ncbi:hypothetical protein ACP70R_041618 [Stipagrostis hirtigluma subsp. patula]
MTEYWVSQGNKWCDFCKIFISNNPFSIRTHELGKRHKDNVTKRLATMQKDSEAKDKEQQQAARALQQIEAKAKKSYQKDLENNQKNVDGDTSAAPGDGCGWVLDSTTGYYYDNSTGLYYDSNSGFYYSDGLGKWVTQEEAYKSVKASQTDVGQSSTSQTKAPATDTAAPAIKGGPAPGRVVTKPLNPMRPMKGATSAATANKRKREESKPSKPKVISKEEEAALKAREAARKRVEDREKPLMGLYRSY